MIQLQTTEKSINKATVQLMKKNLICLSI